MISKCPVCGDKFEVNTLGRRKKYCFKICQSRRDIFRTKKKYVCLNCGKEFFRRPKSDVDKLISFCEVLTGDDLAEVISAIPEGMINSVNLVEQGCGVHSLLTAKSATDNAVPSLKRNLLEGVETRNESKGLSL